MTITDSDDPSTKPDIEDLITFAHAAQLAGFSDRHLRKLAASNEIWAIKLGRNWYTTEQAIRDYLAKNIKRGPKPQKAG
jgi:excisionase family DNA binding protein